MVAFHAPEKISDVGAFFEANHHSIITYLITLDEEALKLIFICRLSIYCVLSIHNTAKNNL